ncbi:MFS transporter [Streptomyces sp. NEAU-Y11]|uniref:MFS transporter n=1 Tax=Streptomyces cucumeris TaxID=2962890 RepID=UPI0020C8A697|nr:MFS transporter [Streptomyces sp. NEAU-Y11]MCP9212568.1 MFS transporter [Streptomyces sp. NEAU-Y11]
MEKRYSLRRYLFGAAVGRTGDETAGPALLLAGLALTGSAASASFLLAGCTVAAAVGGPLIGALLDRSARPGRVLAAALALHALALTAILLSLGRAPFAVTFAIAVVAGVPGPVLSGGWTSQLSRLMAPEAVPRAGALDAMTFSLGALMGPALAGLVAVVAGAPAAVATAVALLCLALPTAWTLPPVGRTPPGRPVAPGDGRAFPPAVLAELTAGVRAILRNRPLARATATSVVLCAGEGAFLACCPLLGAGALGGADRGALLLSASAAASLVANALLARRARLPRPDAVIGGSALVLAVAALLAATGAPAMVIAAALLAGAAEGPGLTALFAVRHREAPERLRGRIVTTGASLKITGFALGAGLAGALAVHTLPGALIAAAGFGVLAALVNGLMSRRSPQPPAPGRDPARLGDTVPPATAP